jgi:protein transport protein SEC61 subunit gamma-like protein
MRMNIASWPGKIKEYALECRRVLKITKKPTAEEFKTIVRVSALGMLIIGFVGFVVVLIKELLL